MKNKLHNFALKLLSQIIIPCALTFVYFLILGPLSLLWKFLKARPHPTSNWITSKTGDGDFTRQS